MNNKETIKVFGSTIREGTISNEFRKIPVKEIGEERIVNEQAKIDLGDNSYELELFEHVDKVRKNLSRCIRDLEYRADVHDASKFTSEEFPIFEEINHKLRGTTYGTDGYKALLKELGPALDHHYKVNDHHPEHFENGVNDMDLFQFVEMLCDWKAAVERHEDGDIYRSLEINKERFGISDQLYQIMKNTIDRW